MKRIINNQGSVLIATLSIFGVLVVLAFSISQTARSELMQVKYREGKLKAKYLVLSGLAYALEQIYIENEDKNQNIDFFIDHEIKREDGKILYVSKEEGRKLNVNAIDLRSADIFISLIVLLGFDESVAKTIDRIVVRMTAIILLVN